MEGYIHRWTNAIFGWQQKYVEVEGDEFKYYKEKGGKLQGIIPLKGSKIEMIANEPLRIIIQLADNTTLYLKCNSMAEKVKWVNALCMAQQSSDPDAAQKEEVLGSIVGEDLRPLKSELATLFQNRILNDSSKLNAYVTQTWTLQGLLEAALSDFSEDFAKIPDAPASLKESAENIKRYTTELKEIDDAKVDLMNTVKIFIKEGSPNKLSGSKNGRLTVGDEVPVIMRSNKVIEQPVFEMVKEENFNNDTENEVFYDAVEEEIPVTPKKNFQSVPIPSLPESPLHLEESKEKNNVKMSPIRRIPEPEPEFRTTLPAKRDPKSKVSIWTVIKDMIGKDLTRFAVPVYFNEPISMLQRVAEIMENEQLLTTATQQLDSLKRIAYVATFNATQYNSIVGRKLKPFNPVLGETFEYVTKKYRFFSEQVSHHPPISACHAESRDYELFLHTNVTTRFWMKSMEFKPLGKAHVILKHHDEHYIIDRPSTSAQNIILGTLYLDCSGESTTINTKTNEKCVLMYHGKGWSNSTYGLIDGYVYDAAGKKAIEIKGKWSESIWMTDLRTGKRETLWKRLPAPEDWESLYCFTTFTLQLNHLSESLKRVLPHTDSRFRPDQRALENGDIKLASDEKYRVEEMQRAARKHREQNKIEYKPAYFVEHVEPLTKEKTYQFNGKYWKDRETYNWGHLPKIF